MTGKLTIIDTSAIFFRSHYAYPTLTTTNGQIIGAIYGLIQSLMKILPPNPENDTKSPHYVVMALDSGGKKTVRHEMFPEYKSNRPPCPPELGAQFEHVEKIIDSFGLKSVKNNRYEADDCIATCARVAQENSIKSTIVSGDKDLFQLVNDHVKCFDPFKNIEITTQEVKEKFGVSPQQIGDYLAIMGDASDNIPGAKGIGPKGAQKLLEIYQNIDDIYRNIHRVKPDRTRILLQQSEDMVRLSYKLASLCYEVEMDTSLAQWQWLGLKANSDTIITLLESYGFKQLQAKFEKQIYSAKSRSINNTQSEISNEIKQNFNANNEQEQKQNILPDLIRESNQYGWVSIHIAPNIKHDHNPQLNSGTPPTGLNNNQEEKNIPQGKERILISTKNTSYNLIREIDPIALQQLCEKIFNNPAINKIYNEYVAVQRIWPHQHSPQWDDIKALQYLTHTISLKQNERQIDSTKQRASAQENTSEHASYSDKLDEKHKILQSNLYEQTYQAKKYLEEINLHSLYHDCDKPLLALLSDMEKIGIGIDPTVLDNLNTEINEKMQEIARDIYDTIGEEFNIASPKQVSYILFSKMKLDSFVKGNFSIYGEGVQSPNFKKTKNKEISTRSEILQTLADYGIVVAQKIIDWRHLHKICGYISGLKNAINPVTQRIHCCFNPFATTTGRLSTDSPNLQSIPIRTATGKKIREAFKAKEGYKIISLDYQQIEIRVIAHIAKCTAMLNNIRSGIDLHQATAAQLFGVAAQEVTENMRRQAKAINFGILYGMSPFGLSQRLKISTTAAGQYIKQYYNIYHEIQEYIENTIAFAKNNGFTETLFKRRCPVPLINSNNGNLRKMAERSAINAPIQGTAADIMRIAMVSLPPHIQKMIVLQIHDEILLEVAEENAHQIADEAKSVLEKAVRLDVSLSVEASVADTWGDT